MASGFKMNIVKQNNSTMLKLGFEKLISRFPFQNNMRAGGHFSLFNIIIIQ